ncbi:IS630 family transposase [Alphaproteobacteria bacterium]|nr:IS630 family transposase [Alphaproteobacteria bacterium]
MPLYQERCEEKRQAFLLEVAKISPDDLIYLDESGIDEILYRPYARSSKKSRVYGERSGKYVARTTLIAAYNEKVFKAPFRFKGYTNTATFNCWVERCLLPDLKPGQTVILDNASIHKSKRTTELIESVGCHVLYQPPYSPDLNKIEPMWANLKNRIRNHYDNSKTFIENLDINFKHMCHR